MTKTEEQKRSQESTNTAVASQRRGKREKQRRKKAYKLNQHKREQVCQIWLDMGQELTDPNPNETFRDWEYQQVVHMDSNGNILNTRGWRSPRSGKIEITDTD